MAAASPINEASSTIVTLLFVHGGSFCKEMWTPITRRMQQSPLWSSSPGVRFEVEAIDLPYHGSNRDTCGQGVAAADARVTCGNKRALFPSCRVVHPANVWVEWTTAAVLSSVDKWRGTHSVTGSGAAESSPRRLLVGIDHSMGSSALWNAEATRPGSFAGLVLFEPICGHLDEYEANSGLLDMVVTVTLQRQSAWPSMQAAKQHVATAKRFASWDRESLEQWMNGAVVPKGDGSVALACSPELEAAFSCGPPLWLPEPALRAPSCPISVHYATRSRLFQPHIYRLSARPVKDATHLMVVEDPAACAAEAVDALQRLLPALLPPSARL